MSWLLISASLTVYASPKTDLLVLSKCSLPVGVSYDILAVREGIYLIKTTALTALESTLAKKSRRCQGFINVTQKWYDNERKNAANPSAFLSIYLPKTHLSDLTRGYQTHYQEMVKALLPKVETSLMRKQLITLTAFADRHVATKNGAAATDWLTQQVKDMVVASGRKDVSVYSLPTPKAMQSSVILKLGTASGPAVIIGAHLDTLRATYNQYKPGADDGGSGVVAALEAARVLLNSGLTFTKPIYFIWYAGSEEGLLGSQQVVQYFNQRRLPIEAVLQLDMTGYVGKSDQGIGLSDELTDAGLSAFVADLIGNYIKSPVGVVRCGYACSDHAVWHLNGNRVAFPFETMDDQGNPYAHTRDDKMKYLSLEQIQRFSQLGVAFAVELGEPMIVT